MYRGVPSGTVQFGTRTNDERLFRFLQAIARDDTIRQREV